MKRAVLLVTVAVLLVAAAVFSRQQPTARVAQAPAAGDIRIASEDKNPWTHLKPNVDPDQFQFVVVTDRTGGHRDKIFSRAVHQVNLLQPEFVMSVGDLIEGYTVKPEVFNAQWAEFDGYVKKLQMPFFYVPGNHDLANKTLVEAWGGRYGRKYYHFLYKDVLFLAVNSQDPDAAVSAEQAAYFKKALDENPNVRWTLVFMHHPLWAMADLEKNGWGEMEKHLAGRKYTVFCGHVHRYQKYVRNGMNYYQLATTGGGSKLRGTRYGEFDHISWITMKKDGPLIANVMLDGVLPEDLKLPDSDEKGVVRKTQPLVAFHGKALFEGAPLAGAMVHFYKKNATTAGKFDHVGDGMTEADGTFMLSTYKAFDGIPAGEYVVVVVSFAGAEDPEVKAGANKLPARYAKPATTPLRVVVKADEKNEVTLELTK